MVFGRTCQKFLDLELLSLSLSLSIVMLFQSCSLPDSLHLLLVYLSIYTFVLSSILLYLHSSSVLCTSAYISCFLYLPTYLPTPTYLSTTYLYLYLSCCPFVYPILTLGHVFSFLLFSQTFHYFSTFFSFSKSAETFISISRAFNHSDVF